MNSESVMTLVARVRTRSGEANSATFSDTSELIPWVRDSLKQIYEILTQRWVDWYTVIRPLSLSAGRERYALPSDYRAGCAVYMVYPQANNSPAGVYKERLQQMQRTDWGKWNYLTTYRNWPMAYRIQGTQLYMNPVPTMDYVNAVELQYVPQWRGPLTDWSSIDPVLPNGWEEWVVLDVLQKMAVKKSIDTTDILRQKSEAQNRVLTGAMNRNPDPPQMTDVYQVSSGLTWYATTPGGGSWAI